MYHHVEELVSGDHASLFYRTFEEQLAAVIPFIEIGLRRNERCLYVTGENSVEGILEAMGEAGIDVEREQRRGALNVASGQAFFHLDGVFAPERMIDKLHAETTRARQDGYFGLRATEEMSWTLAVPGALEKLVGYEAALDRRFPKRLAVLCQYHEAFFRSNLIGEMIRIHPHVIASGQVMQNPWYSPERYGSRETVNHA
jgi:MEDS: MEthanogen/methylotroph, DcmR Sensory domain